MDAEPDPVPSFLPFNLSAAETDAFIDELYFESENAEGRLPQESALNESNEPRTELFSRVHNLKRDLKDWRGMLNSQVKSYRLEVGDLRDTLSSEVENLKNEFQKLRSTVDDQIEKAASKLVELDEPEEPLSPEKPHDSGESEPSLSNVPKD